jgi:2-oxoglutarate dehydrogenase E2 component (dihydrolipoamide succinyltransferase)
MIIEIKAPSPGESVTQVQLANWLVSDGETVEKDTDIAELDSDKATLTVTAPEGGKIRLMVKPGDTVAVGTVLATLDTSVVTTTRPRQEGTMKQKDPPSSSLAGKSVPAELEPGHAVHITPLAKRIMEEKGVTGAEVAGFVNQARIGRKEVDRYLTRGSEPEPEAGGEGRPTERKKMSTLRLKIAERLVAAKNETAMLTTFNEVSMAKVVDIRKRFKEEFQRKHGVSLGFMSFFSRAVSMALGEFPDVNSMIEGDEIIYHHYVDLGIAVSSPRGLMVPVVRDAGNLSLAGLEHAIKALADKARDNKLSIAEMSGGTFTITNGGVFGSMLSTPILNPPQSAILGMHNIVERPIAVNGKVEIHPMMYLALSYDHRLIDGREAVGFLVKVRELIENPEKMASEVKDPVRVMLEL